MVSELRTGPVVPAGRLGAGVVGAADADSEVAEDLKVAVDAEVAALDAAGGRLVDCRVVGFVVLDSVVVLDSIVVLDSAATDRCDTAETMCEASAGVDPVAEPDRCP